VFPTFVVGPLVSELELSGFLCRALLPPRAVLSEGVAVRPEELDKFFRPLLACGAFSWPPLTSIEAFLH
jgi:hypothetical protein